MEFETQDIFGIQEDTQKKEDELAKRFQKSTLVLIENNSSVNITLPEKIIDFVLNNDEKKSYIDTKIVEDKHLILMPKRGRHDTNMIVYTKNGTYLFYLRSVSRKDLEEPDSSIVMDDPKVTQLLEEQKKEAEAKEQEILQMRLKEEAQAKAKAEMEARAAEEEEEEDDELPDDLAQLAQLSELAQLSQLQELTKLQELQKLSSVMEMHKMFDLLKLQDLSKLSKLSQLASLSQLANLSKNKKKKKKKRVSEELQTPKSQTSENTEEAADENVQEELNPEKPNFYEPLPNPQESQEGTEEEILNAGETEEVEAEEVDIAKEKEEEKKIESKVENAKPKSKAKAKPKEEKKDEPDTQDDDIYGNY